MFQSHFMFVSLCRSNVDLWPCIAWEETVAPPVSKQSRKFETGTWLQPQYIA